MFYFLSIQKNRYKRYNFNGHEKNRYKEVTNKIKNISSYIIPYDEYKIEFP